MSTEILVTFFRLLLGTLCSFLLLKPRKQILLLIPPGLAVTWWPSKQDFCPSFTKILSKCVNLHTLLINFDSGNLNGVAKIKIFLQGRGK